jgi:hypothetical protein
LCSWRIILTANEIGIVSGSKIVHEWGYMRYKRSPMLFALATCLVLGCNSGTRYPQLDPYANMGLPQGPNASPGVLLQKERNQAVRFDPYIDNDIGPKVDGGRPRDFGQQLPETVRSRWTQ